MPRLHVPVELQETKPHDTSSFTAGETIVSYGKAYFKTETECACIRPEKAIRDVRRHDEERPDYRVSGLPDTDCAIGTW